MTKSQTASKATKRPVGAEQGDCGAASPSSRERILASAERVFADFGFDGASMRQIALASGTPLALLGYHFGSKEGLYRAVFNRRAPTVVEQRFAGLELAALEPDLDRRLELIVKALVVPMLRLRARDKDPSFGRLMAHETIHPNSQSRGIVADIFDPVARKMIAALASALPDRPPEAINWAYHFMIGAMVFLMADTGRIARLSNGLCRPEDEAAAVSHMVSFLTAAVRFGLPPARPTKDPGGRKQTRREKPDRSEEATEAKKVQSRSAGRRGSAPTASRKSARRKGGVSSGLADGARFGAPNDSSGSPE